MIIATEKEAKLARLMADDRRSAGRRICKAGGVFTALVTASFLTLYFTGPKEDKSNYLLFAGLFSICLVAITTTLCCTRNNDAIQEVTRPFLPNTNSMHDYGAVSGEDIDEDGFVKIEMSTNNQADRKI